LTDVSIETESATPTRGRSQPWRPLARSLTPAAAILAVQLVLFPLSAGLWLRGLIVGGLTALIALGMAITYRSNRIVNFAAGDLGTAPVVLVFMLLTQWHWPYIVSTAAGLIGALVLGAVVELAIIRRFFRSPRLLLTVATLGLTQLLAACAILLPKLWGSDRLLSPHLDPPFDVHFSVGSGNNAVIFDGNALLALIVTPLVIALLAVLLRVSAVGIAVRASADSADRASLLGVPVKRLQTVVWSAAAFLAFVAVFLRAGVLGLPIDSTLSFDLLLRALAALVLGGMTDLVAITASATALGVLEIAVGTNQGLNMVDPIIGAVIFVALIVLRRRRTSRVSLDDTSTWLAAGDVRPIAPAIARIPIVKIVRAAIGVVLVAFVLILPHVLSVDRSLKASALLIYAILGLSLVVLTGWAGQISLGQIGFFAFGAAFGAKATQDWGLDLGLALVFVAAAGALIAVIVGLPALRRRGLELAVITLAFALAMTEYFLNSSFFDWVPTGRIDRAAIFGTVSTDSDVAIYYVVLGVLALTLVGLYGVRRSRTGRALIALRDNERGAQAYSLDATRLRLLAFAMSGAIAAVAGCLLSQHQQAYDPNLFGPFENLNVFTMVIVGGVASPAGAVLGALYFLGTQWFLPIQWQALASGTGVLLILLIIPDGFGGLLYRLRDRWLARVARRHDAEEPEPEVDALEAEAEQVVVPVGGGA
jgi:branched-chain amino acid transport system permease protein